METQTMSSAAQVIVSLIPIVGIVIGGTVVFFYLLWHHKHISLQIKNGTYKPLNINFSVICLLIGMILTGVGIALTAFFLIAEGFTLPILSGLIPLSLGICLIVFFLIYPKAIKATTITEKKEQKL